MEQRADFDRLTPVVALALLIVGCVVFGFSAQDAMHHNDALFQIYRTEIGDPAHPWHRLALVPGVCIHWVLERFGCSALQSLQWTSALFASIGVAAGYRALRALAVSPTQALWAALLVASTPAVFYFATVVELQAIAFGCAAVAFWAFAVFARRIRPGAACVFGAMSGLAGEVHSLLHLLPGLYFLFHLGIGRQPIGSQILGKTWVVPWLIVIATHAAVAAGIEWCVPWSGLNDVLSTSAYIAQAGASHRSGVAVIFEILWLEYVLPYLPCSVLLVGAWRQPSFRPLCVAIGVAVMGCWLICYQLLADQNHDEHGAYLLPLAIPLAFCTVRTVPRWAVPMLVVVASLVSVWTVRRHELERPNDPNLAIAAMAVHVERPLMVLATTVFDKDSLQAHAPTLPVLAMWEPTPNLAEPLRPVLEQKFDQLYDLVLCNGQELWIPMHSYRAMTDGSQPILQALLKTYVTKRYVVEPVEQHGFAAVRVIRLPD